MIKKTDGVLYMTADMFGNGGIVIKLGKCDDQYLYI